MADPWYAPITTEKGITISGAAAFTHRVKLEGGPMAVIKKTMVASYETAMQTILSNFNLLPKRRSDKA